MSWRETGSIKADADCITGDDVAADVIAGAWLGDGVSHPVEVVAETEWSAIRIRLTIKQADALGDAIKAAAALARCDGK